MGSYAGDDLIAPQKFLAILAIFPWTAITITLR